MQVVDGQAGLFTDAELLESAGILWEPLDDVPDANAPLAGPRPGVTVRRAYTAEQVTAFAHVDVLTAFGEGFTELAPLVARINALDVRAPDGALWTEASFAAEMARLGY